MEVEGVLALAQRPHSSNTWLSPSRQQDSLSLRMTLLPLVTYVLAIEHVSLRYLEEHRLGLELGIWRSISWVYSGVIPD